MMGGVSPRPPLEGLRILTVSQFGAGPFGTMLLADLGAEVIKIEDPSAGGDVARYVPPYAIDGDSLYFQSFNRNKKSLALNLQHPEGKEVFHDLVKVSDAVYNNLRGDQPGKLGLTYDALRHLNPKIVCCSLSGFGTTGPRMAEPGYDYLIQGYAGFMSVTGEPDGPPGKSGISFVDYAGGYVSILGLMIGLLDAQRTGIGRDVDVSLHDTAISMLAYLAIWTLNREYEPRKTADSAHATLVPSQNFQTKDGWIVIFCAKEKFYQNLMAAMGSPDLAEDPRFKTFADRYKNKALLLPILKGRFRERTAAEWLELLRGKVPCAPVNSIRQALEDSQVSARQMILEVEHPVYGRIKEVASPIKMGETPEPQPAPALGQHTDDILHGRLGYTPERIADLRERGIIL